MAAPTNHVYLDDGTGTYPIDITSMVRLPDGLTVSGYGRSDESPTAESASFTFTIDNWDGSFSSGVGFGVPGTGVRWTLTSGATTVNRFTGKISSMNLAWPTGGDEFSTVQVTAVDTLADLSRKTLRSMLEQEILLDSPTAYYTLGEPEGSVTAGDTSGNQSTPLSIVGSGAAVTLGSGTGPTDGLTAATFAGGQYLQSIGPSIGTGAWSAVVFFNTSTVPAVKMPVASVCDPAATNGRNIDIYVDSFGQLRLASVTTDAVVGTVTDGRTHCVVAVSSGGRLKAYLDGALAADVPLISPAPTIATTLSVGALPGVFSAGVGLQTLTGTVSHVALFNGITLSAARASAYALALTGTSEITSARLTRLASYAGKTVATTTGSGQLVALQSTSGSSLFDAMQAVATAEGGVFYADGSGALQMQGRGYRAAKTTVTRALAVEEPDPGTTVPYDTQQLINKVTVTRTGGAAQLYVDSTATSATGPGEFPASIDLIVADDASALAAAQWMVNKHKTPAPRITQLTLNPLAPASATGAQILSLAIGDRVSLVMPSQNWSGAGDYVIEGWSETVTESSWSITYNVLPWSLFQCAIYNDAGSVYDTAVYAY